MNVDVYCTLSLSLSLSLSPSFSLTSVIVRIYSAPYLYPVLKVTTKVIDQKLADLASSLSIGSPGGNTDVTSDVSSAQAATKLRAFEGAVQNLAAELANGLAQNEQLSTTTSVGDTEIGIQIIPVADFEGTSFPANDGSGSSSQESSARITLPRVVVPDTAKGHLVSVFVLYASPPPLGGRLTTGDYGPNISHELNSKVISASVALADDNEVSFSEPIRIVMKTDTENAAEESSLCVFYNFAAENNTGAWSTEGCRVDDTSTSHITCLCDHLTNFAILLQINDYNIPQEHQRALQIVSQIGIALSLLALSVAFITIVVTLKSLHNREASVIHLNLIGAMITGHLIFLIGIDDVNQKSWCKAVAILLHFFYLVTFVWMLMEGVHIYFRATRVFKNTSHQLKIYHVFAWGAPIIIVMVTGIVNIDFYGTDQACWLSRDHGAIWAFAGPVVCIICLNVIILAVVLQTFLSIKSITSKSKFEQAKRSTRAAVVLLPLLGITWMIGFLATGSATIFFQYAFAILNSLQGVFICIFHCFTNDDIMKIVKLKYNRSKQQFDAITSHSVSGRGQVSSKTKKVAPITRREAFAESQPSTTMTDTPAF